MKKIILFCLMLCATSIQAQDFDNGWATSRKCVSFYPNMYFPYENKLVGNVQEISEVVYQADIVKGKLTNKRKAAGLHTFTKEFDAQRNLTRITEYNDKNSMVRTTQYFYKDTVLQYFIKIENTFDTAFTVLFTDTVTTTYQFNNKQQIETTTQITKSTNPINRTQYTNQNYYTPLGYLAYTLAGNYKIVYDYDKNGNCIARHTYNTYYKKDEQYQLDYTKLLIYDNNNKCIYREERNEPDGFRAKYEYSYNKAGLLSHLKETSSGPNSSDEAVIIDITYNDKKQVATTKWNKQITTYEYQYDSQNNWTTCIQKDDCCAYIYERTIKYQ